MAELLADLRRVVGAGHVLRGAEAAGYCGDWRGIFWGDALAVVRPASVDEVAGCVAACARAGVGVVAQGGNTGLSGGATPGDGQVVLSLSRLNRVRAMDAVDMIMVVEAGVTLAAAQAAAEAHGLMLPLRIASEGSAQMGGVMATNAGGNLTLRYGNARALMLGLEVVLADGRIWHGLRPLRKDNTGYALAQIFVGSEGTLGIITAACLRLAPALRTRCVAFVGLERVEAALDLLARFKHADEAALQAFEYISGAALDLLLARVEGVRQPLGQAAAHYVLVELGAARADADLGGVMQAVLASALDDGVVADAVMAGSEAQRAALWRLREELTEAQKRAGANVKNDIAVPVSRVAAFLAGATDACLAVAPGVLVVPFGHLGDGNIHFNLVAAGGVFAAGVEDALIAAVCGVARALEGSFSAEHGVGQLKVGLMEAWHSGVALDLMRGLKGVFDPGGVLNPGKVLGG